MILGLVLATAALAASSEFPNRASLLDAMGAEPISGTPRYRPRSRPGRWQLMDLGEKLTGRADPSTGEVRFLSIVKAECERLNNKHVGANRAESVEQANTIANAFVARIRPGNEVWSIKSSRKEFGHRGVPDQIGVFYRLTNVDGFGVDSSAVGLTVHVLRKSGIICLVNLPYYEVTRTRDEIGQERARSIAEAFTFRRLGTDTSGKRGRLIKLTRNLSRDVRTQRSATQERTPLIRAWHAEFEKYQSYLKIDAGDGSLMDVFNGFPPSPR